MKLLPRVGRALQVLPPGLDPLHGAVEPGRDHGDQDVLLVDGGLRPEAAPDLGRDDAQLVRREIEHLAERALEPVRHLRRGPDGEAAAARGGLGDNAPRLHRHPRVAGHADPGAHADGRARQRALRVPDPHREGDAHVVAPLRVEEGCAGCQPRLDVDDGRQGLVLDLDQLEGVLRRVGVGGDDHRDRLADVADPLVSQRELRGRLQVEADAGLERGRRGAGLRERPERRRQVRVREAGDDGGVAAGAIDPDPPDPRVRVRAPEDRRVEAAERPEVVDVATPPDQEARVLAAADLGSDVLGSHRLRPPAPAARRGLLEKPSKPR